MVSTSAPKDGDPSPGDDVRALLESLTGPGRGRIAWLSSDQAQVCVGEDRILRIKRPPQKPSEEDTGATLSWSGKTYEIAAAPDRDLWVNGRKVGSAHLMHGDMIEFGEDGPMTRFRLCRDSLPTHWPVDEILSDAVAYARTSRRPFGPRLSLALYYGARRIILETSLIFRVSVIIVLVVLTTFVALQYQNDRRIEQSIQEEARRLEAIATALAETQQTALTAQELATLRDQLDLQLSTNADRLALLERRLGASARVIRTSTASVAFLQGAYGLRQIESGKMLRHVLGPDGTPLMTPLDKPVADPEGTGDPLEFQFTGTGFLLKDSGLLVTNRHVALPWTANDRLRGLNKMGFEPEMLKLIVFLPGLTAPVEATFIGASEGADLALLSIAPGASEGRGLSLAEDAGNIGDEVIVMGYPTGLRALIAQAGRDFLTARQEAGETGFWTIAQLLSDQERIAPLASRGIIAQITANAVIYDAETTIGGSGGPALDSNGRVVAVNSAILPEFGGANIGVPVAEVHRLLQEVTGK